MARRRRGQRAPYEIWPGFVDALTTLLLVIIFLLVVFVLAQFFLSQALSGRDAALEKLNQQVNELADLLAIERRTSANLENQIAQLNLDMTKLQEERDSVIIQLDTLTSRALSAEEDRDRLTVLLREEKEKTAAAEEKAAVSEEALKANLAELESLKRDIAALEETRKKLEDEVGKLAATIEAKDTEIGSLRDRSKELEARIADEQERTNLAQKDIEEREIRLAELQTLYLQTQDKLTEEEKLSAAARSQVALLNTQINALRAELAKLNAALDASEAKDIEQQAQIADLGKRLNQALAAKVQELQQYRSEFFGKLREVLKNRPGISIVGDRFVFQSEVLFDAGSAELGPQGKQDMAKFAETLLEIAKDIPKGIDWILRVDGHTDKQPISTARFPSNWELSTARAVSVTKFLISQGVPPNRLAATGFGEFQPIDSRDDEIGYLRNRRIELKLTER
ncbi:peptidoglycan -binding protein [Sneathiella chungangensis]|uniref:Peptidoglycan -binding protein n=1 Tax=Sneathiella chungangensis TaxID=1418234 RepID=A0A845MDM3_9PROT|nr:peptidoglycan -binding protein [Sneathiella chungangensis]MZR22078.1 peptidoglycan -binding protein [Sneathiella chungangensis]